MERVNYNSTVDTINTTCKGMKPKNFSSNTIGGLFKLKKNAANSHVGY